MTAGKDFLTDIPHEEVIKSFTNELLQMARNLKSDDLTDRQVLRALQKEKRAITHDLNKLEKELKSYSGRDNPMSPQKKIENIFDGGDPNIGREPPSKEVLKKRNNLTKKYRPRAEALQNKLETLLAPRGIYQFNTLYNGIINEFDAIADGLNGDPADRSEFKSFLDAVFRVKRELSIKMLERAAINPLIAKIKKSSVADIITEEPPDKKLDPWERIDGIARKNINLFIDDNKFTGNNAEIVKAFLISFEIRSQEEYGKVDLGKVDPTVDAVIKHNTYPYDKNAIGKRTLKNRLGAYWDNYRDPSAIEG